MKPALYIGLDGPLLVPSQTPDPLLGLGLASYAKPFMHWAVSNFRVRWLTDRGPRAAFYVAALLGLPDDKIPVAGFESLKPEAFKSNESFYWVDSELIPGEVTWLTQHGHLERFFQVDAQKGVTPELKQALELARRNERT